MQIFYFTVRGMPTYKQEREYFIFILKTKKFPNNYFEQIKSKDKKHIPKSFFFLTAIRWVRVSFPKIKQQALYMPMQSIFSNFILNIDRSNLKLHYFLF